MVPNLRSPSDGAQIRNDHIRVVEYTSLDTKRIYDIAEFFNVVINKEHEGAITKILKCNSKDVNSSPYLDDWAYKHRMATEMSKSRRRSGRIQITTF